MHLTRVTGLNYGNKTFCLPHLTFLSMNGMASRLPVNAPGLYEQVLWETLLSNDPKRVTPGG